MDVKKQYEEKMNAFFELHKSIANSVYVVFKPSKVATLDDLYDARQIVEKLELVKMYLDGMLATSNMRANGQKLRTP